MSETLEKETKELEEEIADSVLQYMSTDDGKRRILNPDDRTPLLKFHYLKQKTYSEEIKSRMSSYVKEVMQKDNFVARNMEIQNKAIHFYKETCQKLDENDLENDLSCRKELYSERAAQTEPPSYVLAIPIAIAAVFSFSVSIVLGGIWVYLFWNPTAKRNKIIDQTYNQYKEAIFKSLKQNSCHVLRAVVNKVMKDLLIRRLNSFEERARQLREIHLDILAKQNKLCRLNEQVKALKGRVIELQTSVHQNASSAELF